MSARSVTVVSREEIIRWLTIGHRSSRLTAAIPVTIAAHYSTYSIICGVWRKICLTAVFSRGTFPGTLAGTDWRLNRTMTIILITFIEAHLLRIILSELYSETLEETNIRKSYRHVRKLRRYHITFIPMCCFISTLSIWNCLLIKTDIFWNYTYFVFYINYSCYLIYF